jgi:hypothetical protein
MTKASIHRFDIFTPSDSVSWVSNGQRQFLQKEGVAYILRYGPSKQHASRRSICQIPSVHFKVQISFLDFSCVECRGNEAAEYISGWRFQSCMPLPHSFRAYKVGILLTMVTWLASSQSLQQIS